MSAPDHLPAELAALQVQLAGLTTRLHHQSKSIPSIAFLTHPCWPKASWSAITFQWHPQSQAPPIMGLVFDDAPAAAEIFKDVSRRLNNADSAEEIRVS